MSNANVDEYIIRWLVDLYSHQASFVQLGSTRSRLFQICRGVRQGDPLSPILFINVMRTLMKKLKEEWYRKGFGTIVGSRDDIYDKLCLISFADDTTIVASSRQSLISMLKRLHDVFSEVGLKLNADKCKVMTNTNVHTPALRVGDMIFPVVPAQAGFKILGTQYTLLGRTEAEFTYRLACAWGRFNHIWPLLRNRRADLNKRLKIFHSDVRQSLLWCCESWNLTAVEVQKLVTTERSMLRKFAAPRRLASEDYISWIVRATRQVEQTMDRAGLAPIAAVYLQRKWKWAGRITQMSSTRWARRVTLWRDGEWWRRQPRYFLRPSRAGRTHWFRWEDSLQRYAVHAGFSSWKVMPDWEAHAAHFVKFSPC